MTTASFFRLLLLAAIWGGSFLFMRISASAFGPAYLIEFRVLFAAICLFLVSLYLKRSLRFRAHLKHFIIIGLFNSALPFVLLAFAAQTLNASTLSVVNSTAVIWGAVIGVFWHKTPLTQKAIMGLVIGVIGVTVLVGWDALKIGQEAIWPVLAGLMATCSYGVATNYTKTSPNIAPFDNAHGNMWAAVLWLLPLLPFIPMRTTPSELEMGSVVALGVLCTATAYLLYFRLVSEIGPASTLSVTFLIPAFGILWGYLFLDEPIGISTVIGTSLVLVGTSLVTGFSFKSLFGKPKP
ncbi:DMT family transporter [Vibrio sp. LaRot3]|uniref:DMT family transporter n=1 Tax=Vibrio sp. LaRot3 TaxID=2998829 RepID=UPI0022CDC5C6|nr:DMT family transporter [Vibrio sp. LaRot3]MDA0149066.1 DMT family transporter [Vibrio sp. LaRot3]